ncbi:hypothetical protein M431DRAFT_462400 [Trichoderma harzianum CBS 226.95]|uniref:Uncharacterized protein n=1 Tax=Trichoderma harzianum CBS 226.95 TaxID=983964 RepID=A0A2T4A8P7_TRIHA|nr:hypothetical protein M431DRAFT_462400 [Trichoderma harzianum CBS 226.95]PTB53431.1 hypothetical protein M431DRAFT_462400 [Trichoderma harzianum CBS 226.95]
MSMRVRILIASQSVRTPHVHKPYMYTYMTVHLKSSGCKSFRVIHHPHPHRHERTSKSSYSSFIMPYPNANRRQKHHVPFPTSSQSQTNCPNQHTLKKKASMRSSHAQMPL